MPKEYESIQCFLMNPLGFRKDYHAINKQIINNFSEVEIWSVKHNIYIYIYIYIWLRFLI